MSIEQWLEHNFDYLVSIRRHLHQHPEVGFSENETSRYLQDILRSSGYKITTNDSMITGFFCEYARSSGPVICIRTDMDALAMDERNTISYKSMNPGIMHGCGHDVHMTIATGLALWIQESRPEISGKIRFLFQPAEEQLPGGSLNMIEAGAVDNVDAMIGYHVLPKMPAGKIGIRHGAMAATVELIQIVLEGKGGHTSRPHQTADLVCAQAHLIMDINDSIASHIDPRDPVVLAFGYIAGGDAINVIPGKICLKGTIRYLNPELQSKIHLLIHEAIDRVSKSSGAEITFSIPAHGPGIFNEDSVASLIMRSGRESLGNDNVIILEQSSMGGEDFGNYLEKIPGAYFRLGCSNGISNDVHTVNFDVDEKCIGTALKVLSTTLKNYFSEKL